MKGYISGITILTKLALYPIQKRIWLKSSAKDSYKRHVIKTLSWNVLGAIDSIIFGSIITGNPPSGLKTIDWYLSNEEGLKNVTSGSYQNYYKKTI